MSTIISHKDKLILSRNGMYSTIQFLERKRRAIEHWINSIKVERSHIGYNLRYQAAKISDQINLLHGKYELINFRLMFV